MTRAAPGATAKGRRRVPIRGLWWVSPTGAVALIVPGSLYLAWHYSDAVYRDAWRTPKALEPGTVALLYGGALVLMIAALIPQFAARRSLAAPWPGFNTTQRAWLRRICGWL
ncbi:MAG TPA: hypothetical protein PLB21_13690, partial [Actinomycetota bacterium]|nr:hypothetical protein [Actinomycetota bacterium]